MRPFEENYPFFCIFLAMISGMLSAVLRSGRTAWKLTLISTSIIAVLSALLLDYTYTGSCAFTYTMSRFPALFSNVIRGGPLQALLSLAFACVMTLSLSGGARDLFHDILPTKQPYYFAMVNLTMASLLALTYTDDVFTGYVFIEISTIAACAMVMAKDTGTNLISTIRYLFMSLLGSGLFLIGLTLLCSATGYLLMPLLSEAVAELAAGGTYRPILTVSIGLMTAGLGIKSAMFPFHLWLPDAHGGATTASSAILSGLVLKGYIVLEIILMIRVFTLKLLTDMGVTTMLLLFGLLGMIFGSVGAMREHHVKRMLAYSSVAQIGYIFMGLGLGTRAGVVASCFHILVHACCKPMLFCCAGRLSAVSGHHRSLRNLIGSAYRDYIAGIGFTVGALSMIGIPLFGGFVSKLYFASASLSSSKMVLVLLTIALSTVLNALYYVPAVIAIWSTPGAELRAHIAETADPAVQAFDRPFATAATILIAGVFVLGIFYHPILDVISTGLTLL
jgi:multicomponent Na+:H+ antiporter subunit D